jgi:hypothetical protein
VSADASGSGGAARAASLGALADRKPSGGPFYVAANVLGAAGGVAAALAITSALGF